MNQIYNKMTFLEFNRSIRRMKCKVTLSRNTIYMSKIKIPIYLLRISSTCCSNFCCLRSSDVILLNLQKNCYQTIDDRNVQPSIYDKSVLFTSNTLVHLRYLGNRSLRINRNTIVMADLQSYDVLRK